MVLIESKDLLKRLQRDFNPGYSNMTAEEFRLYRKFKYLIWDMEDKTLNSGVVVDGTD